MQPSRAYIIAAGVVEGGLESIASRSSAVLSNITATDGSSAAPWLVDSLLTYKGTLLGSLFH